MPPVAGHPEARALVGLAIDAVTGTSYRDPVRSAVFGRAGMAASDFFDRR